MTLESGKRLGPYQIVTPIGAGGMGEVYRGIDTRLGRTVAIKVLPSLLGTDERVRVRFEREARAISALNHPHICTLHDVGREDGVDFLVLEHCEGSTLAALVATGPLPLDQTIEYGMQIAGALATAHRNGIIHRDLKPSNIMITKAGAKVLDFGVAKNRMILGGDESTVSRLTEDGALVGTIQYMAPEVLTGNEADARSDLFALGLVLYEMVAGKAAFAGDSKAGLLASILERDPEPLGNLRPDAPRALVRIITACLRKDPDTRLQTAHDLALALEWCREATVPFEPQRPRWRTAAIILGAIAVLLASLLAVSLMRRPDVAAKPIRRLAVMLPIAAPLTGLFGGNVFAISPDEKRLVYVGPEAALYVRDLERLTTVSIPGTEGSASPFFSPDGKWIGFAQSGNLRKVPLLGGGGPVTICERITVRGAVWRPDDTIVVTQAGAPMIRVPASGGIPQRISQQSMLRWPAALPGDSELLVTIFNLTGDPDKNEIAAFNLDDGKVRTILRNATHGQYSSSGHLLYFRSGTVYRVRFDPRTMRTIGESEPLLDDVASIRPQGLAHFAESRKTIYYVPYDPTFEEGELLLLDRRGREAPAAEQRARYGRAEYGPRLSPDGKQIVVQICRRGECDIWRYEMERATWNRITTDGRSSNPCWSPDGRFIAYASNREGPYNIYVTPSDGSSQPRQITRGDSWYFPSSWSPDGKFIAAFEGRADTRGDISILPSDGSSAPAPFLRTPAVELEPEFSPRGDLIAYVSSSSGKPEVYIRNASAIGPTWKVSDGGGSSPRWRADGKELFFAREKAIMAVDVRSDGEVRVGKPRLLFEAQANPGFDVTGDGQRFLMTRNPPAPPRIQINVVEGLLD